MKPILKIIILLLALHSAISQAQQATAFVDLQKVVSESVYGKSKQIELERDFNDKQRQIDILKVELTRGIEDYRHRAVSMSDEDKQQEEIKLANSQLNFQQKQMEFEQELTLKYDSLLTDITEKIIPLISEVAKAKELTYVVDKKQLLYFDDGIDLTELVLKRMNELYR